MSKLAKGAAYARALARELQATPVDLGRAAPRLGLEIRELNADGFDGALVRAREIPCGIIVIRESIREPGRKRFTLAHEIAHFLLPGHDQTELVCTKSDIGNWGDASKRIEREADDFAAEVLMPTAAVRPIVDSGEPSLQLIEKIAQRFETSLSAAAWRYCDLAKEQCAIVWSTEGRIDWSKRSQTFGFPLRKGTPVQQGTFASRAFAGAATPKQPQTLPANLWRPDVPDDAKLWEQSKALPAYSSVISLLWVRR
jgi:IrrE N-terminal-like domain